MGSDSCQNVISLWLQHFSLFEERVNIKGAHNKNSTIMERFLTECSSALLLDVVLGRAACSDFSHKSILGQ